MCRNIRAALPRALNTISDEAWVSCQYFHLGAVVLNNKLHSWTFFFLPRTHRHTRHRPCQHTQTSRSSSSGENFPVDILCFWHNIDFRGKAAGGLLMNFHITLEEDAKLFTCTAFTSNDVALYCTVLLHHYVSVFALSVACFLFPTKQQLAS